MCNEEIFYMKISSYGGHFEPQSKCYSISISVSKKYLKLIFLHLVGENYNFITNHVADIFNQSANLIAPVEITPTNYLKVLKFLLLM